MRTSAGSYRGRQTLVSALHSWGSSGPGRGAELPQTPTSLPAAGQREDKAGHCDVQAVRTPPPLPCPSPHLRGHPLPTPAPGQHPYRVVSRGRERASLLLCCVVLCAASTPAAAQMGLFLAAEKWLLPCLSLTLSPALPSQLLFPRTTFSDLAGGKLGDELCPLLQDRRCRSRVPWGKTRRSLGARLALGGHAAPPPHHHKQKFTSNFSK